jgi:hypothetical protein
MDSLSLLVKAIRTGVIHHAPVQLAEQSTGRDDGF